MNRKVLSMLAVIATIALIGCQKEGSTAKDANTPKGRTGTAKAPSEATRTPGQTPGAETQAPGTAAQQPQQSQQMYVTATEKTLDNMEQQVKTLQQQQAQLPEQQRQKAQELVDHFNKEMANARASLNKLSSASPEASRDLKVAVDNSMTNLQTTYKELQSLVQEQGQRAVTRQ